MGGFIGFLLNFINLSISTTYFINILDWGIETVWFFGLLQGALEGVFYSLIFSVIFTISFEIFTKNKGTYKNAINYLLRLFLIVFICWVIGGILAVTLSLISPEFYRNTFLMVPDENFEMFKYAFVGGGIWGEILGGIIGLALVLLKIKDEWEIKPNS